MKTKQTQTYLMIASLVLTASPAFAGQIAFESSVKIKRAEQVTLETIKAGESFEIKPGEQMLVIPKQGLPILVFAPTSKDSKIVVQDAVVNMALQEQLQPEIEKSTRDVIDALRRAESLVQKRDYSQASVITASLKEKYKNISAVLFLSGTLNYLMNNKSASAEDLEKGLALDPNNEAAKKLLVQLKGGS